MFSPREDAGAPKSSRRRSASQLLTSTLLKIKNPVPSPPPRGPEQTETDRPFVPSQSAPIDFTYSREVMHLVTKGKLISAADTCTCEILVAHARSHIVHAG